MTMMADASATTDGTPVLRARDLEPDQLHRFLSTRGLTLVMVPDGEVIPGSHWGDDEAGLIAEQLFVRSDTPVHSLLHETCHWLLMDEARRSALHTNAGGTALEECAVCYLQLLLADQLPPMNQNRMFRDMDSWGYSFRLGKTRDWFEQDASDALEFLRTHVIARTESVIARAVAWRNQPALLTVESSN